jgi:N6-adenosine-specific RNA methylase IME4
MTTLKRYKTILCDSPWQPQPEQGGRGAAKNHYGTMPTPDICALPVINLAEDQAVLIAWGMWAMLVDCLLTMWAWGFYPKTGFPWVKTTRRPKIDLFGKLDLDFAYGNGHWIRGSTEPVIIARRGYAPCPHSQSAGLIWDYDLFLVAKRTKVHSRKPPDIYAYAEQFPGPHLELFAREKREGWDCFGNDKAVKPHSIDLSAYDFETTERDARYKAIMYIYSLFGQEGAFKKHGNVT